MVFLLLKINVPRRYSSVCVRIIDNYITCPVHGAVFDLTDGPVHSPPAFEDLQTFEVLLEDTSISVKKPLEVTFNS